MKTLKEMQNEVDIWANQFKVPYFSPLSRMAAMTEELGEIARVMNRMYGDKKAKDTENIKDLEEEIGDLFFSLICTCNAEGIDLMESFETKMLKVTGRDNNRFEKKDKLGD